MPNRNESIGLATYLFFRHVPGIESPARSCRAAKQTIKHALLEYLEHVVETETAEHPEIEEATTILEGSWKKMKVMKRISR
jgi:hypothetical protein